METKTGTLIAEPLTKMNVEYACKRCHVIVRIFSKNLCTFPSSPQHYTLSPFKYTNNETLPVYQKVAIPEFCLDT